MSRAYIEFVRAGVCMTDVLEKIKIACDWVNSKGKGSKDATKVTTQVKWADWDRKWFSPAMAVLWYSEVHASGNNTYETFVIPDSSTWVNKVASYLQVTEEWVNDFVNQCYVKSVNEQYTISVTFNGLGSDSSGTYSNVRLKNPKLDLKKVEVNTEMSNEAQYCIEHYGDATTATPVSYWTKNPPVELYKAKLLAAAYDLFLAIQASEKIT